MASSWTLELGMRVFLILLLYTTVLGVDLSNSFISPNSAEAYEKDINKQDAHDEFTTRTSDPGEIQSPLPTPTSSSAERSESSLKRNPRAALPEPILSTVTATDDLLIFKNVEDALENNDVELSGRFGGYISPSKTTKDASLNSLLQTIVPPSGEAWGAPHARALLEPQEIMPSATTTMQSFASQSSLPSQGRQANPDIQDIITGIVKLLNGNVNVHANTAPGVGRPMRPFSSRINNRGPPRITDVQPLPPDFDVPSLPSPPLGPVPPPVSSTRLPTPYPFDVPNMSPARPAITGTNIPLSEQSPLSKRPGFYRPATGPPWNRRRPPNKRPSIPPYKPMPPLPTDMISLTSDKPTDDIFTLDFGPHLEASESESTDHGHMHFEDHMDNISIRHETTKASIPEVTSEIDKEIADFERNKEKSTKLDKYTSKTTRVTPTIHAEFEKETATESLKPTTVSDISKLVPANNSSLPEQSTNSSTVIPNVTAASSISPSSTTQSTTTQTTSTYEIHVNATPTITGNATHIESSIPDILQTIKEEMSLDVSTLSSTPTEKLSLSSLPKTSSTSKVETSSTTTSIVSTNTSQPVTSSDFPYYPYRPRPGIVLDDTEYKPGGINRQPIMTRPPIGQIGDIFDITVSAIQGPGGVSAGQGKPFVIPVDIDNVHGANNQDVITSSTGSEGFVSIDGKRTYLNLFGDATPAISTALKPTAALHNQVTGTGFAVVDEKPKPGGIGAVKPTHRRPVYGRPRPSQPPVRIDTCIVGDDSTCDASQHEICRTESGVSACHCRPGTARKKHRDPCRKIVSILVSLRVDKLYDRKVIWANELADKSSDSFQQLSYEAEQALESAMSMTPFSDEFLAARVNNIYKGDRTHGQDGVFVNLTLQLDENTDTARPTVRGDIQRHLLGVIQRRSNNIGKSALWVDSPPGSVSNLQDLDECSSPELHDCHSLAKCINVFGGFKCECNDGYRDPWLDNKHRAGRHCEQCSSQHCNNRGECKYQNGQEVCICSGNYYGAQCELDGEVLGVAIGASVAAVIIIGLTLVCLLMWSRRWSREQKAAVGSPVFGYMATASNTVKAPVVGAPPYQLTLEDRLRWAQIADVMAQANHYAPEPGLAAPTRPSSAMFGYPSLSHLGTLQHHGSLPPVPLPRLNLHATQRAASIRPPESTSSEEEDKADLLGRSFQVPRPKSRSNASIANQSGIYYDVDYDQNEVYKQAGSIPLSTYSMGRQQYYRN